MKLYRTLFSKTIASRIKWIWSMTILVAVSLLVGTGWGYQQLRTKAELLSSVHLLQKTIFELNALSQEYMLTGSDRALRQWQSSYSTIHNRLVNLTGVPSQESPLLSLIARDLAELQGIFGGFRSDNRIEMSLLRKEQLSNYSRYVAHDVSVKIASLYHDIEADYLAKQEITWLSLMGLILISIGIIASLNGLIWHRFRQSLKFLNDGIDRIEAGEIPDYNNLLDDEFGSILKRFSHMGSKISEQTSLSFAELKRQLVGWLGSIRLSVQELVAVDPRVDLDLEGLSYQCHYA